jgi:hypothetical protein
LIAADLGVLSATHQRAGDQSASNENRRLHDKTTYRRGSKLALMSINNLAG